MGFDSDRGFQMSIIKTLCTIAAAFCLTFSLCANAWASGPKTSGHSVEATATDDGYSPDYFNISKVADGQKSEKRGTSGSFSHPGPRKSSAQTTREYNASLRAQHQVAIQQYEAARKTYDANRAAGLCGAGGTAAAGFATAACVAPTAPTSPDYRPGVVFDAGQPGKQAPATPQYTPQQAAQIAVARLTVPTVEPGISPAPDLNRWKMAVVGYPLWLFADGATHVGPVTDTVGDLSVSLDASLASVSYAMGDGQTKVCQGAGTKWTEAVDPGTPSPDCGYAYQKASLPAGDYTVTATATWSVTWQINGETGVLPVTTTSATQLPVGELQAVIVAEHH